jgi:hypothetical protein
LRQATSYQKVGVSIGMSSAEFEINVRCGNRDLVAVGERREQK